MTAPLKPCPFCGGTDIMPEMGVSAPYGLYCRTCKGAGPNVATDDPDPAITAWNTRADAPELLALVGALELAANRLHRRALDFAPGTRCHGDVLLRLANGGAE